MATGTLPGEGFRPAAKSQSNSGVIDTIKMILKPIASLKLTIVLFALGIFIVFVGTLAQTEYNIDQVMRDYFRCFIAFIEFKILLPVSWFPNVSSSVREGFALPGGRTISGFYFPGGWAIGAVMLANLFAAHWLKFKIQARGAALTKGAVLTAIGVIVTVGVILYGSLQSGETSDFFKSMPSMRILTQLLLGTIAGGAMLAGCHYLFKKRAGIVVLHIGVGMIMLNELLVGTTAVEGQMPIDENETGYYIHDVGRSELAIIDTTGKDEDIEVAIPDSRLVPGERIKDENLPFDVEVNVYYANGLPRDILPKDEQLATAGRGLEWIGEAAVDSVGTESEVDRPLTYVTFYEKDTNHKIDTHLVVSQGLLDVVVPRDEIPEKVMSAKLFDVKATDEMKAGLDNGSIPDELSKVLAAKQITLSNFAFVKAQARGEKWRLANGNDAYVLVASGDAIDVHRTHDVYLRFARRYTNYTVHLIDVRKDDYVGTSTPRNYSSDVRFVDADAKVEFTPHIWMNNPLRYNGETFYQSGYYVHPVRNVEVTTLQVVSNTGWMIPYVACMIVVVGMAAQFLVTLQRFGNSPSRSPAQRDAQMKGTVRQLPRTNRSAGAGETNVMWYAIPVLIAIVAGAYVLSKARPPKSDVGEFNYYEFGTIPVTYEGRVKPMDTLARTSLRMILDRQEFDWSMSPDAIESSWNEIRAGLLKKWPELHKKKLDDLKFDRKGLAAYVYEKTTGKSAPADDDETGDTLDDEGESQDKAPSASEMETAAGMYAINEYIYKVTTVKGQPATRWLLDLATNPRVAYDHRVIRIDSLEVLDTLGLERRKGFRYSLAEVFPSFDKIGPQLNEARKKHSSEVTPYQKKLMELERKIGIIDLLAQTFQVPEFRERSIREDVMRAIDQQKRLASRQPPLIIPSVDDEDEWEPYQTAWTMDLLDRAGGGEGNPAVEGMSEILGAYTAGKPRVFNREVEKYNRQIASNHPDIEMKRVRYESFFNNWTPFYYSMVPYLCSFVIAMLGFMGYAVVEVFDRSGYQVEGGGSSSDDRRANTMAVVVSLTKWTAFAMILVTLLIHSYAIYGRIMISGRPPVTNLYSSAVFIGWGCVILGLILEYVFRNGLGNIVSAVMGFATLLIAFLLTTAVPSFKGDTFTVLQAVLDTQFWLATHVVCITLGYSTTFLAGVLGIAMIFVRLPTVMCASPAARKPFTTAMYNMTYGVVCFSIFFSFFGTVLGGLWADDSWGRFWGWDPKENGALIIVLWNALLLHARWGGMVKENGFAILAVIGNIVTAWSWFGVNELGVGLHSYGFTEGVKLALMFFWASQLAIVGYGVALNFITPMLDRARVEQPVDAEPVA